MSKEPSGTLPRASVSPSAIRVESPSPVVLTSLTVTNKGGGLLQASLEVSAPWIHVTPDTIGQNNARVDVRLDLADLESDREHEAEIRLRSGPVLLEIPVTAVRLGLQGLLRLYREGRTKEAVEAARKLLSVDSENASVTAVLACALLDAGDLAGLVPVLRNLRSLPGPELPAELLIRLADGVAKALPELKGLEEPRRVFDLLSVDERVADAATAVLKDILERDLDLRLLDLGEGSSLEDPEVVRRDLEKAAARFPDDPGWARRRQALEAVKSKRRSRSGRTRALALAFVLALAGAFAIVFWVYPAVRLAGARSALAAGDYESAERAAAAVLSLHPDYAEAARVRGEAHLAWFKALAGKGDPALASPHLEAALHDLPQDAGMVDVKRKFYLDWAQLLLRQGRFNLAYRKLQVAVTMSPGDRQLQHRLDRLRPLDEFYDMLDRMPPAPLQPGAGDSWSTAVLDLMHLGESRIWMREFERAGLPWYAARLQVMRIDLDGSGMQRLIVAGSQSGSAGAVVCQAHEDRQTLRRPIFERQVQVFGGADQWFAGLNARVVTAQGRPIVTADFLRANGAALGHSVIIYGHKGRVGTWTPPDGDTPVRVQDENRDGVPEIWTGRMVWDEGRPDTSVIVPVPFGWRGDHGVPIPAEFADYYRGQYLPGLEKTLASLPFPPGDPRRDSFRENAEKARKLVESMIAPGTPRT